MINSKNISTIIQFYIKIKTYHKVVVAELHIQFHWHFLIINSCFWLVNVLYRKSDVSWKREMKMIKAQILLWKTKSLNNVNKELFLFWSETITNQKLFVEQLIANLCAILSMMSNIYSGFQFKNLKECINIAALSPFYWFIFSRHLAVKTTTVVCEEKKTFSCFKLLASLSRMLVV